MSKRWKNVNKIKEIMKYILKIINSEILEIE
jgi:hypothetical protein